MQEAREDKAAAGGDSRLAEALGKIKSEDRAARKQAFEAVLALGVARAADALAGLVVEPGAGDDAGARIALHGLAVHVTCRCAEGRAEFSQAVAARLDGPPRPHPDPPRPYPGGPLGVGVKRFLIEQLLIAGREEAVPALASLLADPDLAEPARAALQANPSVEAVKALRDALPEARGDLRIGVILALGSRGDGESVPALIEEASSGEPAARLAALDALGRIGDPRGEPAIAAGLERGSGRERLDAAHSYLRLGESLLRRGRREEAAAAYRKLLGRAEEDHLVCAALQGLRSTGGAGDVPGVAARLSSPDAAVRSLAARCLAGMPGGDVTRAVEEAARSARDDAKAALERVLEERRRPRAF
jgi:HEAT repeat protein